MSLVDPISDVLTRIRNAYSVGKESVIVPTSKLKEAVLSILRDNGYVKDFKNEGRMVEIILKYNDSRPAIEKIERVSRPGRRIYVKKNDIPVVLSGRGIAVLSTSKGLMTGSQAKVENLGGEVICRIY